MLIVAAMFFKKRTKKGAWMMSFKLLLYLYETSIIVLFELHIALALLDNSSVVIDQDVLVFDLFALERFQYQSVHDPIYHIFIRS